jgi:hypothetical protein
VLTMYSILGMRIREARDRHARRQLGFKGPISFLQLLDSVQFDVLDKPPLPPMCP